MDNHTLAEKTCGLASRVNNLAVETRGQDSRTLMVQQDELTKLAMAAIVEDLDATREDYQEAVVLLDEAIQDVDDATREIEKIAKAIETTAKVIQAVGKVMA